MAIEGGSGSDLARWVAAFPAEMAGDVEVVVRAMPAGSFAKPAGSRLSPSTTDSDRHPVGILVEGEPITVPARMYNDKLRPTEAPIRLDARQRLILACIYTRHHDGYVRQRWAREIVNADDSFVVPFVLQLLGE